MYNQKMYSEEEQQQAIITFRDGIKMKVNGDTRIDVKEGDRVTIIGELTYMSSDREPRELRQYIFTTNGKHIATVWENNVQILPKEELKLGDYVRLVWSDFEELLYVVKHTDSGFNLVQLGKEFQAFSSKDTLKDLLEYMKECSVVNSYEILPKNKFKIDVVKK